MEFSSSEGVPTRSYWRSLINGESRNDLTSVQRLKGIGLWLVILLALFCLVGVVLSQIGIIGSGLRTETRHSL